MIRGSVNQQLEATIPIVLRAADGAAVEATAIIDTGFNGNLALPLELIERLELEPIGHLSALVGDGRQVQLSVYEATVVWHGADRDVEALCSQAGTLVGTTLLQGSSVAITVRAGGPVTVDQVD